jgi:hypothetical protein
LPNCCRLIRGSERSVSRAGLLDREGGGVHDEAVALADLVALTWWECLQAW